MSWESNVRKVIPYVPGEQPEVIGTKIKLNTNENPYPPAPGITKLIQNFSQDSLRLYPSTTCLDLRKVLAERYHVAVEQVFVGVGSDDVLATAFLTFFNSGRSILFPDITYSFYDVWANLYGIPFERVPLDEKFELRTQDYMKDNGGVVIANPNAPTGVYKPLSEIRKILDYNRDVVVILDEAYVDFGGESALSLLSEYDNLLVVQTFSKSRSMAGLRIGFAIGNECLIKYLNDVKFSINSYTMNRPSLEFAVAAVEDEAYFQETTKKIIATREVAKQRFKDLGFELTDSMSNFLFVTHPKFSAVMIQSKLREHNIFVRHFDTKRINEYLRITVGTDEEMQKMFEVLETVLV